jgi:hypothetical protein
MRKRKKTGKGRKNALDTISGTEALRGRGNSQKTSPVAFADVAERIEYEPVIESPPFETAKSEQSKKGRHTVEDNFLLGSRNNWLRMFEENWAEIGFALTAIRHNKNSTIEDVRKAFKPLNGTDTARFSRVFVQGLPQQVTGPELRRNRIAVSELHKTIRAMHSHREVLQNYCAQADEALKQAIESERRIIQQQVRERNERLLRCEHRLRKMEGELKELDRKVCDQEAYFYCSELLDFLCGKRRNAIKPLSLANALAGVPDMGWRSSNARCSRMPRDPSVGFPYRVFKLMCRVCRRGPKDSRVAPIALFRIQILALPKRDVFRDTLGLKWRDLRLAIEECWKKPHSDDFLPYAITSAFMRYSLRSKSSADQVLDTSEALFEPNDQL